MIRGFAERLQNLRKSRNLSQKEVADALSISASVISNYESSERTPSVENLISLAVFYRCSTDYLLGLEKNTQNHKIDISMLTEEQIQFLNTFLSSLK